MKGNRRLINIAFAVCQVLFVLAVIITIVKLGRFVAGLFLPEMLDKNISCSVPFDLPNVPVNLISGKVAQISINNISASIESKEILPSLPYINGLLNLLWSGVILYFIYVAKVLIAGVKERNPFSMRLFVKLKYASLFSLVVGVLFVAKNLMIFMFIENNVDYPGLKEVSNAYLSGMVTGQVVRYMLLPLVVFVLAEIFRQGSLLKEEQESII